jgi:hypothetical protein
MGLAYGLAATVAAPLAGADPATAPLVTGRSVATGQVEMENYCTTPAKTCLLYHESWVGTGCSCRVPDGHSRGSVTQWTASLVELELSNGRAKIEGVL